MSLQNTIFKLSKVGRGKKQPPEVFCKKGVLKNFTNFTGKTPAFELLFHKVVGLRPVTLLKRDSITGVFPVKFAKFLRTPILKNIYELLLLKGVFRSLSYNYDGPFL